MADAIDTLKNILGDDAEDKIKNVMSSLSSSQTSLPTEMNNDGLEQIMQVKNIFDSISQNRNDPRTNLLLSLKPYMRGGRQKSIDSAVKPLGLTNITKLLRK